jgi:hypothetical protein
MTPRRSFLLALMISLLFHVGVLTAPSWRLPFFDVADSADRHQVITARLMAQPRHVVPVPHKPPHKRKAVRKEAPIRALPEVSVPPAAEPVPEAVIEPMAEAVPEPIREEPTGGVSEPVEQAPVSIALPRLAHIRYRVTLGEGGFVIGEAIQDLRRDDKTYEMRSSAATTGLAGFFKPVRVVNISQGEVTAGGLRPLSFRIERDKGNNEWANFDWQANLVMLSNERTFPLETGAQDMLSMFAQLAVMMSTPGTVSLPVVTGKKVERYEFVLVGEEQVATPGGERATVHLRSVQANSRESTDVWLGREDALLPVKIRYVDRRGDVYEQIAENIEFEFETEGAH